MKTTTKAAASRPFPPMPELILSTFSQQFFALASGQVMIVQTGEKTQTISRSAFERIYNTLNK